MTRKWMDPMIAAGASLALLFSQPAAAAKPPAPPPVCPLANQSGTCVMAAPLAPLAPGVQPKFAYELPQPVFYNPDTTTNPQYDYYRIQSSPATVNLVAGAGGAFLGAAQSLPDPFNLLGPNTLVPKVWLGLVSTGNPATRTPLYTEVWGYNQLASGNAAAILPGATYPSMSFRATRGKPVKVEWINNLPNQHLFCKQPVNSTIPCAIDRTLMGTLVRTPATGFPAGTDVITNLGGPMQPDNAMVVHLHGGEIPPDSDGFAELWFGNAASAAAYPANAYPTVPVAKSQFGATQNIDPFFDTSLTATNGVAVGNLIRPTGTSMIYNYPMVQDAATIWYHDHALGKTRVNVAAGPAGYFYVQDPAVDPLIFGNTPDGLSGATPYAFGDCSNGGILGGLCRDIPIVFQDRSFNADGSINFPNGLGQVAPKGNINPLTPGVNPAVHPQWVPEYFGDMAVVNGTIWPKVTVKQSNYRFRLLDGSNARCWTLGLAATRAGVAVLPAPTFTVIASDQGFLPAPVSVPTLTMCPGERYEVVLDFSANLPGDLVTVTNTAGAPFPAGPTPQAGGSPYVNLAQVVQFQVTAGVPAKWTYSAANWTAALAVGGASSTTSRLNAAVAAGNALTNRKFFMLNEVLDPISKAPLRVQIDGKSFEAAVTETPKRGTYETWQIANTTVDAHPMHLHLVGFKVISRQTFNVKNYLNAAAAAGALLVPPQPLAKVDPTPFLTGAPRAALPQEGGFKDTAIAMPGEVLTLVARWDGGWADRDPVNAALTPNGLLAPQCQAPAPGDLAIAAPNCRCVQQPTCAAFNAALAVYPNPQPAGNAQCNCVDAVNNTTLLPGADGVCDLPVTPVWAVPAAATCGATLFKPYWQTVSAGPYVWHCHIVDHEDNEMMRPTLVIP